MFINTCEVQLKNADFHVIVNESQLKLFKEKIISINKTHSVIKELITE